MSNPTAAAAQDDIDAVTRVATEYFQAWFAGDGARIRAVLHPALAKRAHLRPGTDSLLLDEDPVDALVTATNAGHGRAYAAQQDVTVLDIFGTIATVMVRSQPFVEYLHLGKFGEQWLIVNALYLVKSAAG